eukprot:309387_1
MSDTESEYEPMLSVEYWQNRLDDVNDNDAEIAQDLWDEYLSWWELDNFGITEARTWAVTNDDDEYICYRKEGQEIVAEIGINGDNEVAANAKAVVNVVTNIAFEAR